MHGGVRYITVHYSTVRYSTYVPLPHELHQRPQHRHLVHHTHRPDDYQLPPRPEGRHREQKGNRGDDELTSHHAAPNVTGQDRTGHPPLSSSMSIPFEKSCERW